MPQAPEHSQSDKDFLTQLVGFAERKAVNGVLLESLYSASRACPVLVIVALGEQALALQQVVMANVVPDTDALIERVNTIGGGFNDDSSIN